MRSRCNAVRHGLTAETVIGDLEDAKDYQAFEAAVIADYGAETAVERELVLRLASILWRLRRATKIETAVFDSLAPSPDTPQVVDNKPIRVGAEDYPRPYQSFLGGTEFIQTEEEIGDSKRQIGDYFLRLAALPTFPLDRLSRYECTLWRQARQIVFTLHSSRRRSRSQQRFPFSFHAIVK